IFWGEKRLVIAGFLGLTLLAGVARFKTSFPYDDPNFVGALYGQKIEFEGVIVREPDVRPDKVNLTVRADNFRGNVLLNAGRYPEYQYGDRLKIAGLIEEPFESDEFSYKDYLSRFDTYGLIRYPKVEKIAAGQGNLVVGALLAVKHRFQEVLSKSLPEPHNALVLGIILGVKRSFSDEFREALIIAGVSHIVVVSGYNISVITRNILRTRSFWGRNAAFALAVGAVLAFVILTGAEASVIRAAIMGLALVIAMNVGRIYQARNILILAAALMIAQNPRILAFDVGFQLSFAATLGLIYAAPIFEKWLQKMPNVLWFRTNLASTLAALLFTLPLLIYYFDRISLVAIPANVLILWAVPFIMFFGFIAGSLGIVYLPLAKIAGSVAWVFLEYAIRVVEFFAQVPLGATAARVNTPMIIVYYLLLISGIWIYRNKKKFYYEFDYIAQKI
ncbi:MAG: ComEC/Rec2 family competence protein, partial [bacterium]|nr:ComEC/Rec2 family competence protein [bacterium]